MANQSLAVLVWWASLCAVSVVNLTLWAIVVARIRRSAGWRDPAERTLRRRLIVLSALFTFGCAFRSWFPLVEGERFCLYDGWFSNAVIARSLATVAELALVAQWTLLLSAWAKQDGSRFVTGVSWLLLPMIVVAECFSWYSALTTNFFGSVIEESIWAATASLMTFAMFTLFPRSEGARRRFIGIAIVLNAAYVVFMCTIDVPMYALRWRRDLARNAHYVTVREGLTDAWQRRIVTYRWDDWQVEIPWMSLYFSAGVWISISLIRAPLGRSVRM